MHSWVTSLKWPGQKRHREILRSLGSEIKVALIPLESKRHIFQGNRIFCVCYNMEITSQGDDREIKDSLLTKIYKTSKEKATISQRKTVAQTSLEVITTMGLTLNIDISEVVFSWKFEIHSWNNFASFIQIPFLPMQSDSCNVNEYMCSEGLTHHWFFFFPLFK